MEKKARWIVRLLFIFYMLYIACAIASNRALYGFLLLNTFLAYIPIEIAMHIKPKQSTWIFILLFILWLLFYPNAPYVLTDLFHLAKINPYDATTGLMVFKLKMWWHYGNLVFSALISSLFGIWSLSHVSEVLAQKLHHDHPFFKFGIVIILTIASSVGVYVGRFLRLHTVYLFMDPRGVMLELIKMWNGRMLAFVIMISVLQLAIWLAMNIYRSSMNYELNHHND